MPGQMIEQVPRVVRIKRKRNAPSLPGFVLGHPAKRPALQGLSIAADQPRRRFRLIATETEWGTNVATPGAPRSSAPRHMPSQPGQRRQQQREQRQLEAQRQQDAARYQRIASLRNDIAGRDSSATLVLERCELPKPELMPFGPPLPPARRPVPTTQTLAGCSVCPNKDDPPSSWHAALAAVEAEQRQLQLQASADICVFDVYEELELDACDGAFQEGEFEQELRWDEPEDDLFDDDGGGSAAESDSQGEVDYPDEEESDDGSDAYI